MTPRSSMNVSSRASLARSGSRRLMPLPYSSSKLSGCPPAGGSQILDASTSEGCKRPGSAGGARSAGVLDEDLGVGVRGLGDAAARVAVGAGAALPVPVERPEREPRDVVLLRVPEDGLEVVQRHRLVGLVGLAVHRGDPDVRVRDRVAVPVCRL